MNARGACVVPVSVFGNHWYTRQCCTYSFRLSLSPFDVGVVRSTIFWDFFERYLRNRSDVGFTLIGFEVARDMASRLVRCRFSFGSISLAIAIWRFLAVKPIFFLTKLEKGLKCCVALLAIVTERKKVLFFDFFFFVFGSIKIPPHAFAFVNCVFNRDRIKGLKLRRSTLTL